MAPYLKESALIMVHVLKEDENGMAKCAGSC